MGSSEKQKKKEAGATPLTQEQVAERFAARYSLAVKAMVNSVDADAAVLRSAIIQALNKAKPENKEDAEAAIEKAASDFCASKPNSWLAKFIQSGGNVINNWNFENGRGSATIAAGDVKKAIEDAARTFRGNIFTDAIIYDAQRPREPGVVPAGSHSDPLEGFAGEVGRGLMSSLPPLMNRALRIGESEPRAKDPIPNVSMTEGTYTSPPGTKRSINDGKPCIKVTHSG